MLVYLCSLVKGYDGRLGAEVKFRPRDAIKALGWSDNTQSLERLQGICEDLRAATLRIRHGDEFDTETAAALVASHTTSLDQRKAGWSATLPAALLNALQAFRTFVKFDTLAALPNGVPTMLYLFLRSEKSTTSEWDVQELTTVLGMTSTSLPERRRKTDHGAGGSHRWCAHRQSTPTSRHIQRCLLPAKASHVSAAQARFR